MDEQQQHLGGEPAPMPDVRCPAPDLFPLDVAEVFAAIKGAFNGTEYTLRHFFATPDEAVWREYWRRSERSMTADRSEKVRNIFDSSEANEWLWDKACSRVEGYGDLPDNWRDLVPVPHKVAAVRGIAQVFVAEDEIREAKPGEHFPLAKLGVGDTAVVIEAGRNGMVYPRLTHRFATPSSEHEKRWSRLTSTTYRVQGRKRGEIREEFPDINGPLVAFYDELIKSVEGYQPNDPKRMDPLHKVIAVSALLGNFRPAPVRGATSAAGKD